MLIKKLKSILTKLLKYSPIISSYAIHERIWFGFQKDIEQQVFSQCGNLGSSYYDSESTVEVRKQVYAPVVTQLHAIETQLRNQLNDDKLFPRVVMKWSRTRKGWI